MQVASADTGAATDGGYVTYGASTQSVGDYSYASVNASSLGVSAGAADSGLGAGTIQGFNVAATDAGSTSGQVYGNPSGTFPVDVPTSIDSSAFDNAIPVTVGTATTGNSSYATVSPASADISQANGMAQSAPVDTIETEAAQGDFGALAGEVFDGIAGIFGGLISGIAGGISGILGGGATGYYGGGATGYYGGGATGYYGGGATGASPVVLDLKGNGVSITPLSSSNMFFDMANNGYAQKTAWAGAGNGVLVYDPGGGPVTQADQVNFTLWDPSAKTDMQALEQVFDTNHDGVLNASDASWSDFYVLVTNADGTTTLETMAQAGVTSIDLQPNSYKQVFTDGSSIDGETTFTRSDGSTGTAATVTFANDGGSYTLQQTVTQNADGSTTVLNSAYNPDGTLAETISTNTSASGLDKTTVTSDGSGIVLQTETDDTVVNVDGSTTETLTDYNGSGVLLDSTVTTTVATGGTAPNGSPVETVTIGRDPTGTGYTAQQEIDTTNPDGSTSVQVSDLTRNGTLIDLQDRRQIAASSRIRHSYCNIVSLHAQKYKQCFESI